jgi:hypothetical protein
MLHKGFLAMLHETDSHLHTIAIQNRLCKPNARRCEGGDIRGNLRMHAGVRFFAQMTRGREPHRGHTSCNREKTLLLLVFRGIICAQERPHCRMR